MINVKSDKIFDCVHLFYYKCHKEISNRGRSYIDSPDWIKSKKVTINTINRKAEKCFQYPVTVALNHKTIEHPEDITKVKPFTDRYVWERINHPP